MGGNLYFVYLLASQVGGTLYVGVTGDLEKRISQHRSGEGRSFTKAYGVMRLVWYEAFGDIEAAIQREKRLKKWKRQWKIELIEEKNPQWVDLLPGIKASADTGSPGQAG